MSRVEVYISDRSQNKYQIHPPKKMTVQSYYVKWAQHALGQLSEPISKLESLELPSVTEQRELRYLTNLETVIKAMLADLTNGQPWVYGGGAGSERRRGNEISFKPVKVDRFGSERIWKHDKRFLLMAAMIPDVTVSSLGWTEPYKRVMVESQFHPRNRQVVVRPVANVSRKRFTDGEFQSLMAALSHALSTHPTDRVLIHSVSYALRDMVLSGLRGTRRVYTYQNASGRARAISEFKRTPGSVLLAPGLERGVDLPGDLCRAQIILKVPYLNLGDKQVSERLWKTPDGPVWYNQHVATTILQMVGRGVRSVDDWCVAYVLDSTFVKWYREWGHLLPGWFRKAIRIEIRS